MFAIVTGNHDSHTIIAKKILIDENFPNSPTQSKNLTPIINKSFLIREELKILKKPQNQELSMNNYLQTHHIISYD